jgi:hypothetical protein
LLCKVLLFFPTIHQWWPLSQELEDGLLLNFAPAPSSVAVGKGNVKSLSLSGDDSSDSGSEESEESDSGSSSDGSDSSSTTSSSGSHSEMPVKPSFPTGVGTAVVSTAELIDAVSATSVAAQVLGPELPSASLFQDPPEDTLPETYGPGKPEEADNEATDEGIMDVTNAIFEEENDDVDEEKEDIDGNDEEEEQEGTDGTEEEEEVDYGEEEEEQAVGVQGRKQLKVV